MLRPFAMQYFSFTYFAIEERIIGGSWSGSPTRMIFSEANNGRKTVL